MVYIVETILGNGDEGYRVEHRRAFSSRKKLEKYLRETPVSEKHRAPYDTTYRRWFSLPVDRGGKLTPLGVHKGYELPAETPIVSDPVSELFYL